MSPFYPFVANRAGHRCEYCRAPEVIFNSSFEVEHILPRSLDGTDENDNLALSCRSCNLHKSNYRDFTDPDSHENAPLFSPRRDNWEEHFQLLSNGEIKGLTSIGRATVACLQINSDLQLAARQQWTKLGIFP